MTASSQHEALLSALRALPEGERTALLHQLQEVQAKPLRTPAALLLRNTGDATLRLRAAGQEPQVLGREEELALPIRGLPPPQREAAHSGSDRRGFDVAPSGLVSLRLRIERGVGNGRLSIDLRPWHKHAARFGVPHAYVQGASVAGSGTSPDGWQMPTAPVTEWEVAPGATLDLAVIGIGVDLSGMVGRFAEQLARATSQGEEMK